MEKRGYNYDFSWKVENYRGSSLLYVDPSDPFVSEDFVNRLHVVCQLSQTAAQFFNPFRETTTIIYPEHNDYYLKDCLENLKSKNAKLHNSSVEEQLLNLALKGI